MQGMQSVTLGSFNLSIVLMSFVISVFGSWCGLSAARRARRSKTRAQWAWLFAAAVSIGGGAIWSMHFIGMLAYDSKVRFSFDIPMTVGSLVAAIAGAMIGQTIATRVKGLTGYVAGGAVTGLGVCIMHYMGMYAMKMPAAMMWRAPVVIASVVIAVAASTLALYFALNLDTGWMMIAAAVVMGIGVCVMHYVGMFALELRVNHDAMLTFNGGVDPFSLALPIFAITAVLLIAVAFAGLIGEETAEDREGVIMPANLVTDGQPVEQMPQEQALHGASAFLPQQRQGSPMPATGSMRTVPSYGFAGQGGQPQFQAPRSRPRPFQPQMSQPAPGQHSAGRPAFGRPAAGQHGVGQPGAGQPAGQPGAARPAPRRGFGLPGAQAGLFGQPPAEPRIEGTTSSGLPRRR